jgi:NAD(P)H-flavin reductase
VKKMCVVLDEREVDDNPFKPDIWRIVRKYPLTGDVNFFQARPVDVDQALKFNFLPGQFVMMSILGEGEAPFCISSPPSRPGLLEFCIRKMGTLTDGLFGLKENQTIGIRGPYGNGFPMEKMEGKDIMIIGGGMGVAPLRSLLLDVLDNRDKYGKLTYLHGARTPGDMLFREEFLQLKERDDLRCLLTVDKDDTAIKPFSRYNGRICVRYCAQNDRFQKLFHPGCSKLQLNPNLLLRQRINLLQKTRKNCHKDGKFHAAGYGPGTG